MPPFDEDSRVKIPALVHFTRIGYEYLSKKEQYIDPATNIFVDQFQQSINVINNTDLSHEDAVRLIHEIGMRLSGDDLGKAFYSLLLTGLNGLMLVDFDHPERNLFQVVTELTYKNEEDKFQPDIVPLLNGMPLAFVEVKIPNNRDGILAERDRIHARFQNKKFRKFVNLTQFMVFSNNSEYDCESRVPIQGAFYASPSYHEVKFNCFREEDPSIFASVGDINTDKEKAILKDTNLVSLLGSVEYRTNLNPESPTNRILTSLFSKERFLFLLRYGIAYVEKKNSSGVTVIEKHIMRYPQLFATFALERKLDAGVRRGIIWHTQGSGKTAFSFYNVRVLRDYFQRQGKVAKFYFIVDRLDLMTQAMGEFTARGLGVVSVSSREEFVKNIQSVGSGGVSGRDEMNVVNIQKFSDSAVSRESDYNVEVQRVYFLDEAHRSYNPKGSFLANLLESDRDAIIIALTGTPLIGKEFKTRDIFGDYIHQYYYNRSIADGYTLRLIREGIETRYRMELNAVLDEVQMEKGSLPRDQIYAHPRFVSALTAYIVDDFLKSRVRFGEKFGGMIVCDSAQQAREIFAELERRRETDKLSSALILHDVDDKSTRHDYQEAFKKGEVDLLVVYNMLLTGFDAPILKKLYLGRVIKEHNLLQALTRVNRPFRNFSYGYVVDFADIRKEFDKTNQAYFAELQNELGDEFSKYSELFKDQTEIEEEIAEIEERLFLYETGNLEVFSQQISAIEDKQELLDLRKVLMDYKSLYNLIRLLGYEELRERVDVMEVGRLLKVVLDRIALLNLKSNLEHAEDMSGILNMAFDQIQFSFRKVSEAEMVIADQFRDVLERTRRELSHSLDPKDPEYVSFLEELRRIFAQKNVEELTASEMEESMSLLEDLRRRAAAQNRRDEMLCRKYRGDVKFLRSHKRLRERCSDVILQDTVLYRVLMSMKDAADEMVLLNSHILDSEGYFMQEMERVAVKSCEDNNISLSSTRVVRCLSRCVSREYYAERKEVLC